MPSVFRDRFKRSGFPRLLRHFGEPVVYNFRAGGSRSIVAIIEREPPGFYDAGGNLVLPSYVVRILDDGTDGVLVSEIDTGGDTIELAAKVDDDSNTEKTVMRMLRQDTGVIVLALL